HWDKFNAQVQANARVKELAQLRKDLVFVDVVPLMLENGKPRKKIFVTDGLHMNRQGYDVWIHALKRALDRSRGASPAHCQRRAR
ncbi:MAG: hypothetical protein ACR2PG_01255, partial [Hyphomicrobiaceae bacterium]